MLEKPDLQEDRIISCVKAAYGVTLVEVIFLPLGADLNTAVYRGEAEGDKAYFLKLRSGIFDELSVVLPKHLSEAGLQRIIPPLATLQGRLWADLDKYKVILYPHIEGRSGYEVGLTDRQWIEFGATLRRVHNAALPRDLLSRVRQETYSPKWRKSVLHFLDRVGKEAYKEAVAARLAAFVKNKRDEIFNLAWRAERLAGVLIRKPPPFILCHTDLHAGNLLIPGEDIFFIIDWDDPLLAPKERDLMYVGGGLMGGWRAPDDEESYFYRGYGPAPIDPAAHAYYRYERIIQDLAIYCEQILLSDAGGEDREQSLHYLKSNFLPDGTIQIAYQSDRTGKF